MKLEDLLKEWSELEPKRCSFISDSYCFWLDEDDDWTWADEKCDEPAIIQYAVQQSIEARGWGWNSSKNKGEDRYYACVDCSAVNLVPCPPGGSKSTAHALLAAYLQAIKQTAEVAG